ncbi:TolC family outer membrane protein [Microvirga sp. SRT01]|uniref:TolC family outer membrane protein n=1 Tax=Sphingomonas longa TaxID=2778730 RepID=A0ABS2D7Y7_9SPHN|nr:MULTISPECIES: TolC family outer membrane protein [Alphaproteobacteria]MBM6577030.1 TolC family outer membrane protein [Sphingomonas sp. BT552]MBR7710074.1 TolC family outer membrane protein [Microvirga sp. SRT01]
MATLLSIGDRRTTFAHRRRLAFGSASRVQPVASRGRGGRLVASLLLLAGPTTASGETLADAIVDAYRSNPRLQAQRAELRALDETVIEALSPYRLGAQIAGNLNYNERRQRGISTEGFTLFEQRTIGVALTVNQLLTSGGRTAAQVSAAEADVLSGRERLRELENNTLLQVVDAYVSVRRDQQLIAIQLRAVESYDRQVRQNQSREREGDLARTDVSQAQAQLFIIRAALAQAKANLEQSRSRFATLVGRNPGALDTEPPLPGVPATSGEAQTLAADDSPVLWQAKLAEKASRHRIAAARAERNPTIAAQGSFGYVNPLGFQSRDLGSNVGGGVTFTLPILTQGVVGSRVRAAIAAQQSAGFQIEDARRSIAAGILNAWNQTVTAQEQLSAGMAAIQAAEAAATGVRRGFGEGLRSNFEVIDSEQRLLNAQVLVVNARYGQYLGQATLLAFIGRLRADALVWGVTPYDPTNNLVQQRRSQIGPYVPFVRAYDKLSVPSGRSRDAPVPAPVPTPQMLATTAAAPGGPLASDLPDLPQSSTTKREIVQ